MSDPTRSDQIHNAIPVEPSRRRRRCASCGGEDIVKFGRAFGGVEYLPAGSENNFLTLARRTEANLWVCLDCGFLAWFMKSENLDQLREQHG